MVTSTELQRAKYTKSPMVAGRQAEHDAVLKLAEMKLEEMKHPPES